MRLNRFSRNNYNTNNINAPSGQNYGMVGASFAIINQRILLLVAWELVKVSRFQYGIFQDGHSRMITRVALVGVLIAARQMAMDRPGAASRQNAPASLPMPDVKTSFQEIANIIARNFDERIKTIEVIRGCNSFRLLVHTQVGRTTKSSSVAVLETGGWLNAGATELLARLPVTDAKEIEAHGRNIVFGHELPDGWSQSFRIRRNCCYLRYGAPAVSG